MEDTQGKANVLRGEGNIFIIHLRLV